MRRRIMQIILNRSMSYRLHLFLACFILLMMNSCTDASEKKNLSYEISHKKNSKDALLQIDMNFEASEDGTTTLIYQDKAWGQDSLFNSIGDIRLLSEGKLKIERDSNKIVVEHDPSMERLKISYTLTQDYTGPTTSRKVYRPIIQPEYFQVFGQNLLILPESVTNNEAFDLSITWKIPEKDFSLQSSFGNHQRKQIIRDVTQDELYSSVFVGGDFRIHDMDLQGNQVAFAIRDSWEAFDDSTMVELLKNTLMAQRKFWNDHSQPYFSVTMIPIFEPNGSSWQGTGLTNSFALAASNNEYLEVEGLVYLLNHELQHNWIGLTIKNDNEEEQYWFSEGFTDYYTLKNIAINRIFDLDEKYFIRQFNSKLKNLYESPVVASPNFEINYDNFWKDRHYSDLPYLRGAVFAFILDRQIQRDSMGRKSLDDVMKQFHENSDTKLSHPYFVKTVNPYLKEDFEPFFNRHIVDGEPFEMEAIFKDLDLDYQVADSIPQLSDTPLNISKLGFTSPAP